MRLPYGELSTVAHSTPVRTLHIWDGGNLAAATYALADAILASDVKLYSYDKVNKVIVRLSSPASDPTAAARIRELHGYKGKPGDPDDPARGKGIRLIPMISADKPALRAIIAEHIATEKRIKAGKAGGKDLFVKRICSFAFKPSADTSCEPDGSVLDDLLRRVLPERLPTIKGIISAPIMPRLPASTNPEDLLRPDADTLITTPGLDHRTGWFLAPTGASIEVPPDPTRAQIRRAADLLREPWQNFPFVSPGGDLIPEVSRSVALFGMMLAVNRRALDIAPGIGVDTPAEGASTGKTLDSKIICIMATGEEPIPVGLSGSYEEQRKALITYFVTGNGSMLIDNVLNGMRVDSAALNLSMTSSTIMDRLLGANKDIIANTQTMIVMNGCALNIAGELASRFLKMRLDTGLERPQNRSSSTFKIRKLIPWMIEHRQQLAAAVHTIVRAYLQECRKAGGTPPEVTARRVVDGSRFGGEVEVLRDALLWAFPDLPDPFLGGEASALSSSTRQEKAQVLHLLDQRMAGLASKKEVPKKVTAQVERLRVRFLQRWERMTAARRRRWEVSRNPRAGDLAWEEHVKARWLSRYWRSEIRAGRTRFSTSEILLDADHELNSALLAMLPKETTLGSITLGRWLKSGLVDSVIDGLVIRSVQSKAKGLAQFWIEQACEKQASRGAIH